MSATGIDEAKLEAFMGQAVTDMGGNEPAPGTTTTDAVPPTPAPAPS